MIRNPLYTLIFIFTIIGCSSSEKQDEKSAPQDTQQEEPFEEALEQNPYVELRNMALEMTPEKLNLEITETDTMVYGLIMDWSLGDAIVTLVSFNSGEASVYLSSGGVFIGGGEHEVVSESVIDYIEMSHAFMNYADVTQQIQLPTPNNIQFIFLTNRGKFQASETMQQIESGTSRWYPLFEKANEVISNLRSVSEN